MGNQSRSHFVPATSAFVTLSMCLTVASAARAQGERIAQMVHTSWSGRDGAPQGITAMAQTPDGVLWIGGYGGLFQFDGVAFEPFRPPTGSPSLAASTIRFLFVSKTGDLWLFPFHGPPARIHHGEVRTYGRVDGEPLEVLGHAQESSDGTLWAVLNERHLIQLGSDDAWHQVPDPLQETGHISKLFIDSKDTQWVIENNVLYRRPHGQTAFAATRTEVFGPAKIVEDRDHTLWVLGQGPGPANARTLQHVNQIGQPLVAPKVDAAVFDVLLAADDSLWISRQDAGLRRFSRPEMSPGSSDWPSADAADVYVLKGGIAGFGELLLKDRDDNIWLGGMGGLDRFEHADLVPAMSDAKVGIWFTCVDTDGEVWIGEGGGALFAFKNGRLHEVQRGESATNLFCGADGRVYFLRESGIAVLRDGHVRHLPLLSGFGRHGDDYLFLGVEDEPNGDVIAAVGGAAGHGLFRYEKGRWSPFLSDRALPEVSAMLNVPGSGLYVGFTGDADHVGRVRANALEMLSVPIRPVGFAHTSHGVVAYGLKGIALERDGRFHVLSFQHPEQGTLVTGLVESRNKDLWLTGARGVVRIPAADVRAATADWSHAVSSMNLREGDFVGPDVLLLFRHSAHIDRTGRLWFSMLNGVVSADPDHLGRPREPPQLSIRAITADGQALSAKATLSPDTQYVDVKYFGLDLSHPRDVVYRYRLAGLNTAWLDAGDRTDAIYTHLRPGQYTFQVMASNGNDVWTTPVSSVTFTILPHVYQRGWFQLILLLLGASAAWAAGYQRVRSITNVTRIRAEERADERVRIARELHDTLLQGVQGLLLSFHVAAEKVPSDHESKRALEKALATADRIILEGRNRVTRLRSDHLTDAELTPALECFANDLDVDGAVHFVVERRGGAERLENQVVDEVFSIAREAMTNAFRHAHASRVVVELDYGMREFGMSCRDNGRGFNVEGVFAEATNGHFGIRGMAERAKNIGATISCRSAPQQGTDVIVVLPARRAYVRPPGFRRWLRQGHAS
jgi:signal transduction histidine kinase/ligand-binding sensor domain-containing protein